MIWLSKHTCIHIIIPYHAMPGHTIPNIVTITHFVFFFSSVVFSIKPTKKTLDVDKEKKKVACGKDIIVVILLKSNSTAFFRIYFVFSPTKKKQKKLFRLAWATTKQYVMRIFDVWCAFNKKKNSIHLNESKTERILRKREREKERKGETTSIIEWILFIAH